MKFFSPSEREELPNVVKKNRGKPTEAFHNSFSLDFQELEQIKYLYKCSPNQFIRTFNIYCWLSVGNEIMIYRWNVSYGWLGSYFNLVETTNRKVYPEALQPHKSTKSFTGKVSWGFFLNMHEWIREISWPISFNKINFPSFLLLWCFPGSNFA